MRTILVPPPASPSGNPSSMKKGTIAMMSIMFMKLQKYTAFVGLA